MKFKFALVLLLLLTACGAPAFTPLPSSATSVAPSLVPNTKAFTPIPTFTSAPQATPTPVFQLDNVGKTVAYDFTAHICEANWMTGSVKNLPCPGDINNPSVGYVGLLSGSDQGLAADFPMLLTFPAYNNGAGLFGRFPKFQVGPNDEFRTSFTCRSGNPNCEIEFTLGYYDANGKYQEVFPLNYYRMGVEPSINFVQPLNSLNGKTVEFVLVVRAMYQSDPNAAWGLWIAPRILR
jgi:hypothetical protein